MKKSLSFTITTGLCCLLPILVRGDAATAHGLSTLYDESANGTSQISAALELANMENKRVLVDFGANWCSWCHKLHDLFESDANIAKELADQYVVVMVDVNKEHNKEVDEKYGRPTRFGLPVLVVLDVNGAPLVTEDTAKLEQGDHHDPRKVISFLKEWSKK
jgi:thiol:disulfide interchange protein